MATKEFDILEKAVNGVLNAFEKYSPTFFDALNNDNEKKTQILEAARKIALEEVKLAQEFSDQPKEVEELQKRFEKLLPKPRVIQIQEGFLPQTFQIEIKQDADNSFHANFTRDGKSYLKQKQLNSIHAIEATSYFQIASIVVEAVLLVLQCIGVEIAVDEQTITKIAEDILPIIENSSDIQNAVAALKKAADGGSNWEIAKAIFQLIVAINGAGILWEIIKSLCSNMSMWEWAETAALVTAMIIASLATDGAALIAKIVLALYSANNFLQKLVNLNKLDEIRKQFS